MAEETSLATRLAVLQFSLHRPPPNGFHGRIFALIIFISISIAFCLVHLSLQLILSKYGGKYTLWIYKRANISNQSYYVTNLRLLIPLLSIPALLISLLSVIGTYWQHYRHTGVKMSYILTPILPPTAGILSWSIMWGLLQTYRLIVVERRGVVGPRGADQAFIGGMLYMLFAAIVFISVGIPVQVRAANDLLRLRNVLLSAVDLENGLPHTQLLYNSALERLVRANERYDASAKMSKIFCVILYLHYTIWSVVVAVVGALSIRTVFHLRRLSNVKYHQLLADYSSRAYYSGDNLRYSVPENRFPLSDTFASFKDSRATPTLGFIPSQAHETTAFTKVFNFFVRIYLKTIGLPRDQQLSIIANRSEGQLGILNQIQTIRDLNKVVIELTPTIVLCMLFATASPIFMAMYVYYRLSVPTYQWNWTVYEVISTGWKWGLVFVLLIFTSILNVLLVKAIQREEQRRLTNDEMLMSSPSSESALKRRKMSSHPPKIGVLVSSTRTYDIDLDRPATAYSPDRAFDINPQPAVQTIDLRLMMPPSEWKDYGSENSISTLEEEGRSSTLIRQLEDKSKP